MSTAPADLQPVLREAFEQVKADFRDDRLPAVSGRLAGEAVAWGAGLLALYRREGRNELAGRDALTRFWVLRFRGMPTPADLTGAPAAAGFVMAFTAFPYLDAMMEMWSLGHHRGIDEQGRHRMAFLTDGLDQGRELLAERGPTGGWCFDLMPLYRDKALALEAFVGNRYGGDFDAFIRHYVAEHDLAFDMDQAWRPLESA